MIKHPAHRVLYLVLSLAIAVSSLPLSGLVGGTAVASAASTWSNPVNISNTTNGWTGTPSDSVTTNDVPFAAFEDRKNGDAGQVMENDKAGGNWLGAPLQLTSMSTGDRDADIVTNKNNYTVVGWQSYSKGGGKTNIFVRTRGTDGKWSGWLQVSKAYGSAKASSVSFADDVNGNIYAVWMQSSSGNDSDFQVYMSKSTNNGYNWSEPSVISGSMKGTKWPKIAVSTQGKMVVAWMQNMQIYATENYGGVWHTPHDVSSNSLVAHNPSLAADTSGNIHMVWDGAGADGFDLDVYYREWKGSSNSWMTKRSITPLDQKSQSRNAVIAVNPANDEVIIVYMDDRERSQNYYQLWYTRGTVDDTGQYHSTVLQKIFNTGSLDKDVSIIAGKALHMVFRSNMQDPKIDIMYSKLDLVPPLHAEITQPTNPWSNQTSWNVAWTGTSPHGDPHYRIRVGTKQPGVDIVWSMWFTDTASTSATFNAQDFDSLAHGTYYFQAKAIDTSNGLVEEKDVNAFDKKVTVDQDLPTGDFQINGGARSTNSATVNLTFTYSDTTSSVQRMSVSNNGEVGMWAQRDPAAKSSWNIKNTTYGGNTNNDEMKTIYVKYLDQAMNRSDILTHTIYLDKTPPAGSIVINHDAAVTVSKIVTLTLSGTDSSPYPVKRFKVGNMVNGLPQWTTGWQAYTPDGANKMVITPFTLAAGVDGGRKVVVMYEDEAGNRSALITDKITLSR
jgi:hypothetical protein